MTGFALTGMIKSYSSMEVATSKNFGAKRHGIGPAWIVLIPGSEAVMHWCDGQIFMPTSAVSYGLTQEDIDPFTGAFIEYGQAYISRDDYESLVNKPTFQINVIELSNVSYPPSHTVASLPSSTSGGLIFISDESGGPTLAFYNGQNWLRIKDNVVVS